jgi:hypothetical protein
MTAGSPNEERAGPHAPGPLVLPKTPPVAVLAPADPNAATERFQTTASPATASKTRGNHALPAALEGPEVTGHVHN